MAAQSLQRLSLTVQRVFSKSCRAGGRNPASEAGVRSYRASAAARDQQKWRKRRGIRSSVERISSCPSLAGGDGAWDGVGERREACSGFINYSTSVHTSGSPTTLPLSPAVRYLIDRHALDPSLIPASGPHARLLKGDVLHYIQSSKAASPVSQAPPTTPHLPSPAKSSVSRSAQFTDIPVTEGQRARARSAVLSKANLPHSYASIQCHIQSLLALIRSTKGERNELSWLNSYLIKAAALTLQQLPQCNAVWSSDSVHLLPTINIAVEVASEGRVVTTPVIRSVNRVSVEGIAAAIDAAKTADTGGSILAVQEAALMVSSLISSGLTHYTAVIQPPHSSVLTLGGIQLGGSDESMSSIVSANLSCDARVMDCDLASEWLCQFRNNVEVPST